MDTGNRAEISKRAPKTPESEFYFLSIPYLAATKEKW